MYIYIIYCTIAVISQTNINNNIIIIIILILFILNQIKMINCKQDMKLKWR